MTIEKGFKFNHTAKEKAIKLLEEEQKEKESIKQTKKTLKDLGIEVL